MTARHNKYDDLYHQTITQSYTVTVIPQW